MTTSRPVVLVTGANQGIGFATVKLLAKTNQYTVILGSRDIEKGNTARKEIIDSEKVDAEYIHTVQLDVQNDESILAAAERVKTKFGVLDVLINNAGKTAIAGDSVSENRAKWLDCFE